MKVLFLTRLFWPHGGGVEKHVLEVSKQLVAKNYTVTIVTEELTSNFSPMYQKEDSSANLAGSLFGIEVVRFNPGKDNWFKKFRIWKWLWQNRKLINQADVVHAHDVFFWYLPFRFMYPTKPVYTTFHGYETKVPPDRKAIFWRKVSEKLSWGNICVGDFIKKWYGTKPTYVTYGGTDILQSAQLKAQNNSARPKIILVGRLEKDIGVAKYLQVLDELKEKKIDFNFEAYGEGSLAKDVGRYGTVHNFTPGLVSVMENADVVFASSYLTILQAFAAKRLVVAVYDNVLKKDYLEMAPFAGSIVLEETVKDTAEKLLSILNNTQRKQEIIDAAFTWVKDNTWEDVVVIYIKLWNTGRKLAYSK